MNVLVSLFNSLPGAAGQGLIWGIMAIGVYITYKILDVADLTANRRRQIFRRFYRQPAIFCKPSD